MMKFIWIRSFLMLFFFVVMGSSLALAQRKGNAKHLKQQRKEEREQKQQEDSSDRQEDTYYVNPLGKTVEYKSKAEVARILETLKQDIAKARQFVRDKKYQEAIELYNDIYGRAYQNKIDIEHSYGSQGFQPDTLKLPIAKCYSSLHDYELAFQYISEYVQYMTNTSLDIRLPEAIYRAEIAYKTQRFSDAIDIYTDALTQYRVTDDSVLFYVHFYRGIAYYNLESLDEAAKDFKKASSIKANRFEPYYNLGRCFFRELVTAKQLNEAIGYFDKAIHFNPTHMASLFLRGRSYERLRQYKNALVDFDKCLDLDPTYADAAYKRALMHFYLDGRKVRQSTCKEFGNAVRLGSGDALVFVNQYCKKQ